MTATDLNAEAVKICTEDDCVAEVSRAGLCGRHYQAAYRAKRAAAEAAEAAGVVESPVAINPAVESSVAPTEDERAKAIEILLAASGGTDAELRKTVEALTGAVDGVDQRVTSTAFALRGEIARAAGEAVADAKAAVEGMLGGVVQIQRQKADGNFHEVTTQLAHRMYAEMVALAVARQNTYAYGPSGTGKTHAAPMVAEELGLPFYAVEPIMTKYDLIGFVSPITGEYNEPAFYKAMKHGGVLLFDELDNSDPSAVVCFNVALSNGWFQFPNGERVKAHEDFIVIACGNTDMRGQSSAFNARRKMDGSVPARYCFQYWGYDNDLELALSKQSGGDNRGTTNWVSRGQSLRAAAEEVGVPMNISQRSSINGSQLIASGFTVERVEDMTVWQGLDRMQRAKVENAAR